MNNIGCHRRHLIVFHRSRSRVHIIMNRMTNIGQSVCQIRRHPSLLRVESQAIRYANMRTCEQANMQPLCRYNLCRPESTLTLNETTENSSRSTRGSRDVRCKLSTQGPRAPPGPVHISGQTARASSPYLRIRVHSHSARQPSARAKNENGSSRRRGHRNATTSGNRRATNDNDIDSTCRRANR